ncbi:hypothetical protein WMY93_032445 [Mugilogobius chulae]|uniref:Rhodanese domain-containing protein n=1 Tax=Mugilogobius chulae TaxID=88201 RepID=A0AAW0MNJ0_9GOBI
MQISAHQNQTGHRMQLSKYMEKVEDMKRNYRYRRDEIFKRLKVTTFAQLSSVSWPDRWFIFVNSQTRDKPSGLPAARLAEFVQTFPFHPFTSNEYLPACDLHKPGFRTVDHIVFVLFASDALLLASEQELESLTLRSNGSNSSRSTDQHDAGDAQTARSTLLSVISGVGELSVDHSPEPEPEPSPDRGRPYPDCPYLLLDVRDRDQYESCHIISAHSFPIAFLSRTMNPYTKEVLEYKNAPGKIIIVYDEDERAASQAATTMCQRGFENLFMLSGGLKVLSQKFPGSLVSGRMSSRLSSVSVQSARSRQSSSSSCSSSRPWK